MTLRIAHLATVDTSLKHLLMPQLAAIGAAGHEPIGISAAGPYVADLERAGVRHIALDSSRREVDPLADVRAARELGVALRRERIDILHTHNTKPGLYGRIVGRIARVPIVVNTVHGLYAEPSDTRRRRALIYALEGFASRFSDCEFVQSIEDFQLMLRLPLWQSSRLVHLGNGIDLSRFSRGESVAHDRAQIRSEIGAEPTSAVVGIVGRLEAIKGYSEFFEAAKALHGRALFVSVGESGGFRDLKREELAAARDSGVRFLGQRSDVDRVYAAMDLFVLPSYREGIPRAAMEAAAMSLPIVTTDVRGNREVVTDGVNGRLVPPKDPRALAVAIGSLLASPEIRLRMGEASRLRAIREFDERRVVGRLIERYALLAKAKGLAF